MYSTGRRIPEHSTQVLTFKPSDRTGRARSFALLAITLFIVLYALTGAEMGGDTYVYVKEILKYEQSKGAQPALIWEFGHLLWRPLGYFLWHMTRPVTSSFFRSNPLLQVQAVLFGLNFVGGAVLSASVFAIARRLGMTNLLALAISVSVLVSNAVLNYVHSGTAYVPGLGLQMLGVWCVLKAAEESKRQMLWAALGGVALGLACDVWFLYILGLPAAWTAEYLFQPENSTVRKRMRLVLVTVASTAALGITAYLIGMWLCHISSVSELQRWITNSGHGMHADRPWVRFPTGISRTFLHMGEAGLALKRLVLTDPYATGRLSALVVSGIWKVALVFLTLGGLVWYAGRSRNGSRALAVLAAAAIPTFAFAFFFETSSPERYLPLYPALIAAVCFVLAQSSRTTVPRWILGIFFAAMLAVNLKMYAFDVRALANESFERARLMVEHTGGSGVAIIMSFSDPLSTYFQKRPFDPANRDDALPLYHVFEFVTSGPGSWNKGVSCRVLHVWQDGGEAWLSKRFLAARPQPDWGWVENDHPDIRWTETRQFFAQFDADAEVGGADGFERMVNDSKNRAVLERACAD